VLPFGKRIVAKEPTPWIEDFITDKPGADFRLVSGSFII